MYEERSKRLSKEVLLNCLWSHDLALNWSLPLFPDEVSIQIVSFASKKKLGPAGNEFRPGRGLSLLAVGLNLASSRADSTSCFRQQS